MTTTATPPPKRQNHAQTLADILHGTREAAEHIIKALASEGLTLARQEQPAIDVEWLRDVLDQAVWGFTGEPRRCSRCNTNEGDEHSATCPIPELLASTPERPAIDVERLARALAVVTNESLYAGDTNGPKWRAKTAAKLAVEYDRLGSE